MSDESLRERFGKLLDTRGSHVVGGGSRISCDLCQ